MNSVSIIGRLTKDYEVRHLASGKSIGELNIAVDDGWGDNKHVSYFDVVVLGNRADTHGNYIKKGSRIAIQGRLKQERWEGKDGTRRSKIRIIAVAIEYLDPKPKDNGSADGGYYGSTENDDDLPF